jgi:hypothetical protein
MNESKQNMNSTWIDPDDAPELDDAFFAAADLYDGEKLVRRGRPKSNSAKVALTHTITHNFEAFACIQCQRQSRVIEQILAIRI